MKKLLSLVLALVMLLGLSSIAFAADMGVQVIGGPEAETEAVNLDDLKLNVEAEIDDWGIIKLASFSFEDYILKSKYTHYGSRISFESGDDADYAVLYMDIVNITMKNKNYLMDYSVRVVYDDKYEYEGFIYQYVGSSHVVETLMEDTADILGIDPMYEGHYLIGCTLPNAVVSGKKPLQMIITIDGNEITYNIRK